LMTKVSMCKLFILSSFLLLMTKVSMCKLFILSSFLLLLTTTKALVCKLPFFHPSCS
jgi:hypothetical protein